MHAADMDTSAFGHTHKGKISRQRLHKKTVLLAFSAVNPIEGLDCGHYAKSYYDCIQDLDVVEIYHLWYFL